jgi:TldD protein
VIDHDILRKALKVASAGGADYADIFVENAVHNRILADDRKLKTNVSAERGVGIRVVKDGHTYYAITNSFEEPEVLKVAAYVRDAAGGGQETGKIGDLQVAKRSWPYPFAVQPALADTDRKTDLVHAGEEIAWMTPHTIQATVIFRDHQRDILLASTLTDTIVSHTLGLTEYYTQVIVEKGGVRESGSYGYALYGGIETLTGLFAPENVAKRAAEIASSMLTARECPRGEMPVVFASGHNGILFHEACGHGMEADLVEKGSSFAGLMDQAVASPLVTLVDDGTMQGYPGSFEFDDEGTPSQRTTLIENGTLRNYMHSSVTAQRFNAERTGSARRESFHYPPIPRMRNTFILAGKSDPADIIKNTKHGLYAVDPGGGGQVNVITGEFITSIKRGIMIEDGKLTYPVKGASIIGRGIDALRAIDMVGTDMEVVKAAGRCGKGQQVPVGVGMPTVRVRALTVGGTGDAYAGGKS